jgi:hypothetical protein
LERLSIEPLEQRALLTPTATIVSIVTDNTSMALVVDYTNVNVATLGTGDIQYAANGRAPMTAVAVSGPTLVNGKERMVYRLGAYDGAWGSTDTGTYQISSPPGQILGEQGQSLVSLNLASYWLWFAQPKARMLSQSVRGADWLVTMQYDALGGIDETTIDGSDVGLTGGTSPGTTVLSITHLSATSLQVVYSVAAPGGAWNFTSNGTYGLVLNSPSVADNNGRLVSGRSLGQFYLWFDTPRAQFGTMTAQDMNLLVTVTFTAAPSTVMNPASLVQQGVVTVTGPNGYSQPGQMVGILHNGDGSYTLTYSTPANGTSWDFRDTGVYSVRVNPGLAQDLNGKSVAGFVVGSQTLTFTQPAGVFQLPTFPTKTQWDFVINFEDDFNVDPSTVNAASIRLLGPDGGEIAVALVSTSVQFQGTVVAQYHLTAPGGLNNGNYQVWLNADGIRDGNGNSSNDGLIASFWLWFQ